MRVIVLGEAEYDPDGLLRRRTLGVARNRQFQSERSGRGEVLFSW
jgi:hypothetical protein